MKKIKKLSLTLVSVILVIVMTFSLITEAIAQTIETGTAEQSSSYGATVDEAEVETGNIIGEDKTRRDEFTKYFITDTGSTIVAQYGVPVHYKNAEGEYVDFDNSLVTSQETVIESTADEASSDEVSVFSLRETKVEEDTFTNKKSDSKVSHFKKSGKAKLIEITKEGHTISWGYSGANIVTAKEQRDNSAEELTGNDAYLTLTNLSSKVVYENIYNNIDLEVINSTTGVKENLIVKASNAKNVFKMEYNIGDLIAESVDNNTIELKDNEGKVIYTITAPYMVDANGEESKAVELKILSNNKGKFSVKLTVDKNWLKDKDRAYPVTIDPYFEYGQDWGAVHSTYISQYEPNKCFGYGSSGYEGSVYVGRPAADGKLRRTLVKIPNLPELGTGDMIVNADVALWQVDNDPTETMYVGVYEATGDPWEQGEVTWNTQPSCSSTLIDYQKFSTEVTGWRFFDVTELVKKWYDGATNNGFYLKMMDETNTGQGVWFTSSSYPTESDYRPAFILEYLNNKGYESYWDYTPVGVGTAGTAYVNNYSGSMVFSTAVADTHSLSMSAGLSLTYNSYMAGKQSNSVAPHTGSGWNMSIQETVLESDEDLLGDNQPTYPYVYTDSDGTEHYFKVVTENEVEKMIDDSGYGMELTVDDTHDYRMIKFKDGHRICFDGDGRFAYKTDTLGNEVSVTYSGNKIKNICDNDGKKIVINDTNSDGYVDNVVEPDGKTTTFTYTTTNNVKNLTKITRADGTSINFEYTNNMLTTIKDVDGSKICFAYSSGDIKRVTAVQEYGGYGLVGQKMTFNYDKHNITEIQTSGVDYTFDTDDDIITVHQFDNFGRNVSKYSKSVSGDKYLGAVASAYTSATSNLKKQNKVVQSYSVGANKENLVVGHNLESTSNWKSSAWGADGENNTVTFTATANTSEYLYGKGSLKMNVSAVTGDARGRVYQDVSSDYIEAGATYTLSCYVNTGNLTPVSGATNYGAVISAALFHTDGSITGKYSNHITYNTDEEINDGFRRISVTFTAPDDLDYIRVNLALRAAKGTVYFDGVQLEKSEAASDYNMLENASFERYNSNGYATSWPGTNLTISSSADYKKTDSVDGDYSFSILGDVELAKNAHQDVVVSGNKADTYILSGWAKGNAVPNSSNSSYFELRAKIYYSDGSTIQKRSALFNTSTSDWQYSSFAFNLDDEKNNSLTPTKIRVYLISFRQADRLYFDNLQLIKKAVPTNKYDDEGNLESVVSAADQVSTYEYNDNNKLIREQAPKGEGYDSEYSYFPQSELLESSTNQSGVKTYYTYDEYGNTLSTEIGKTGMPYYLTTNQYTYPSANGTESKVVYYDQDGNATTKIYDANSGTIKSATDVNGTTKYTYNADNDKLLSVTHGNQSVSYTYTNNYKYLLKSKHGKTTYNRGYNYFGNVSLIHIGNINLVNYVYGSHNGNLAKMTYGNGDYVSYTYDEHDNPITISHNGTIVGENFTNSSGMSTRTQDFINNLETRVAYDYRGRLISKDVLSANNSSWKRTFEYGYDLHNNISKINFIDNSGTNTIKYAYEKDDLIYTVTLPNGKVLTFGRDGLSRVTSKTLNTSTNLKTVYTYYDSERPDSDGKSYTTTKIKTEESNGYAYKYEYYADGNIKAIYNGVKSGTKYTYSSQPSVSYEYDIYGQLKTVKDVVNSKQYSYTYDNVGNITKVTCYEIVAGAGVPGSAIETNTYTYGDSNWGDLLTAYNDESITYDTIGNPLTYRDGITMTWQNGRELASLTQNGKALNFTYDLDGMRTKKAITSSTGSTTNVEYVYENGLLMQMKYGSYVLTFNYDSTGTPIGFRAKTTGLDKYYYYGLNSRGDVIALYNEDGTLHATYEYDTYGKLLGVKASDGSGITSTYAIATLNPLRYRGYVYDNETGLYYLQSRYYDPEICRFINADGLIYNGVGFIGYNMFVYCNNNPVALSDDYGNYPTYTIGVQVGNEIKYYHNVPMFHFAYYGQIVSCELDGEVYVPTKRDQRAIAQTIYGEAGGRLAYPDSWQEGQEAVAWTIINRYNDYGYPDDWYDIVTAENQFLGYGPGKSAYESGDYDQESWDYAYEIAGYMTHNQFDSIDYPAGFTSNHVSFRANYIIPDDSWYYVCEIGGNIFFCE